VTGSFDTLQSFSFLQSSQSTFEFTGGAPLHRAASGGMIGWASFGTLQEFGDLENHRAQYGSASFTKIFREIVKLRRFDYAVGYIGAPRFQRIGPIKVRIDSPVNYFVSPFEKFLAGVQIAEERISIPKRELCDHSFCFVNFSTRGPSLLLLGKRLDGFEHEKKVVDLFFQVRSI
jgi:hypothetical protein